MNKRENAVLKFKEGFSCSQAILSTFASDLGLDRETALKIADGFGGGMGNMGETCGAVTGAFMVLGLKYGRTRAEDDEAKEEINALVREFVGRFRERHGSIRCGELVGCDISTHEGEREALRKGLFDRCPVFVRDASAIIEEIL
jgi:C_GCAxxG_C_C family probable redox protein